MNKKNNKELSIMQATVKTIQQHYKHTVNPDFITPNALFPLYIKKHLLWGIGLGAVIGLLLGSLLYNDIVSIPQAEEMYSVTPLTFHLFWIFIGISAGILIVSVVLLSHKS